MTDQETPATTDAAITPDGLDVSGAGLWVSVTAQFDLDVHEQSLLLQACRAADRLDALAAVVEVEGLLTGTGAVHPGVVEQRQQSLLLARLIAALRLPEDAEVRDRPQRRGAPRGTYPGPRAVA